MPRVAFLHPPRDTRRKPHAHILKCLRLGLEHLGGLIDHVAVLPWLEETGGGLRIHDAVQPEMPPALRTLAPRHAVPVALEPEELVRLDDARLCGPLPFPGIEDVKPAMRVDRLPHGFQD